MSDELNASGIDIEDYEDQPQEQNQELTENSDNEKITEDTNEFDLTSELLTLQGIKDKNKIKFQDESGAIIEKSWDNLSNEEKIMILSNQEDPETSLDNEEIKLINLIRNSGLSPEQYIQNLLKPEQPVPVFKIDELTDDELFCLDLLDKMGENANDITDEEIQQALDIAKQNKNLFDKQVASLRVYYKDAEMQQQLQKELEDMKAAEQEYEIFQNNIVQAISNFNNSELLPVELSRDDMENLASYILDRDQSGYSEFANLLKDPTQLAIAAFWMLNASTILDEFLNLIKEAYLRGYNETNKDQQKSKVFAKTSSKNGNNNQESQFAYFDEDSYLTV